MADSLKQEPSQSNLDVQHGASPRGRYSPLASFLLAACAYLLFWQIAPRIRTDSTGAVLISTVVSLSLIVWFTAQFARTFSTVKGLLLRSEEHTSDSSH